jgi:hypothetical protein
MELDDLYCIGCNYKEPTYNNVEEKKLYICQSYVMKLWNANDTTQLDQPTTRFDNCGFKKPEYFANVTELSYVIPSIVFNWLN